MTIARLTAAMLLSAFLWCVGLVFLRAFVTGAVPWLFFPLGAGVVTALCFTVEWAWSPSRNF